ncbi:MAG: GGDEF domain-containing protein [Deltaproteobacteria bacterium]|nr:GGDEF domain-containing protein [Deltaproteobacteria bacterium]
MAEEFKEQTVVTNIPETSGAYKEKQAYIIFLSGPLVGKIHLLEEGNVTLGRGTDVSITIADLGISRHHITLHCKKGVVTVQDMGSTNGTYVNGHKVKEQVLQDGDKIQISSSTIIKFAHQDSIENIFHKELYKMAVVDALTGAYNKRFFEGRLKEEFSYCLRNKVSLSLLMFDIDFFKQINDTHGHRAGDFVLTHISTLTRSIIRQEDIYCRYGGEEFCVLLKGTEETGAAILAERLRRLIEECDFTFDDKIIRVTISIGVTTLKGQNFADSEAMMKLTDTLLYQSKNGGRNRVTTAG